MSLPLRTLLPDFFMFPFYMVVTFLAMSGFLVVRAIPLPAGAALHSTITITTKSTVDFGGECSGRTLYHIIKSCLVMIAACVYRSVHQNIPDPSSSMWGRLKVKFKIAFYGLIAPNMMICWAMRQRFGADVVAAEINKISPELQWTQTHGHFAQMGGFGRTDNKQILHPHTLIELLKNGQLDIKELQLTKTEIQRTSRTDIFTKFIVASQTAWFVVASITRLWWPLPLSELEVMALGFSMMSVITYALWWNKPLNVLSPVYIHIRPLPTSQRPTSPSVSTETFAEDHPQVTGRASVFCTSSSLAVIGDALKDVIPSLASRVLPFKRDTKKNSWYLTTWKRLIKEPFLLLVMPLRELFDDESVDSEARNVSTFYGMCIPQAKRNLVLLLCSLISLIFAAIHFLSWNSTFPTHTQLLLWRGSSIVLAAQPCLLLLLHRVDQVYLRMPKGTWRQTVVRVTCEIFVIVGIFIGPVVYIVARLCLLVLAFLTLRDLPPTAFMDISWTSYIPHLE
ncbi:hypothetical protein BDN72DRAFT_222749 [Pluteus cervinus]|uniref:Uncharacterized protein n=1 Tax=Pluteus cervinus TaxID=181527 RepID=A0ACD3AGL6_9AGAR|nr:hypothetical protein BDN72DRAFT_222749 [Pluteus cervinus]